MDADAPVLSPVRPSAGRTLVELMLVIALASVWFFWGAGVGDLIGTEGLRALIVKEMLARGDWLIPTVHDRVYLRKPPLQAWTTAALARAVGHFGDQVARWPSAALGVLYVVMMYFAARWLVEPRAGPAGAFFALANWFVIDYGMRAELDIGVLFFTGLAILLLGRAWLSTGWARWVLVALGYLAAILGSFWKAPHVMVAVWLTVLALAWLDRRAGSRDAWRFVFHPAKITIALVSAAIVGAWYLVLGQEAGAGRVASFTALEFLARIVPRNLDGVLGILNGPLEFAYVALPFNLYAAALLLRSAAADRDAMGAQRLRFVLAWALANVAFMLVVAAKSPRYWFTCFPPLVVLATFVWQRYSDGVLSPAALRAARGITWGWLIALLLIGATLVVLGGLVGARALSVEGVPAEPARNALLAGGAAVIITAAFGCGAHARRDVRTVGAMFVLALIALKPPQVFALLPYLSVTNTYRPVAVQIAAAVPDGETIFVLSERTHSDRSGEVADLGYYTDRTVRWPRDEDDLAAQLAGRTGFVLVRKQARERLIARFPGATELASFDWPDGPLHLFVAPASP
jgi:4-amino-4-deoxy-L-arabinose transferase-like glycosyltransferase